MDSDSIDDFLDRATRVNEAVKEIAAGKAEKDEKTRKKILALSKELQEFEEEKKEKESNEYKLKMQRKGRNGKGFRDDYLLFCPKCFLEYEIEFKECSQCCEPLISKEERQAEIRRKVSSLQGERNRHKQRKARYAKHVADVKIGRVRSDRGGTDYNAWDFWEPDTDSDEDPVLPNTPEFKAMEKDMLERAERREQEYREANEHRNLGNQAFRQKDLKQALREYTKAIEIRKDVKEFYTNRALVYLKLGSWTKAIKDCTTVLDIWEFLQEKKPSRDEIAAKALVRRAQAYKNKKQYNLAVTDLQQALDMRPSNSFTLNLLKTCKRDLHDETVAQQALELATTPTNPTKSTDPATSTPESVIPSRKNAEGQGDRKETAVENTDENGFLILEAATDSIGQAGVQEEVKGGGERRIGIASDPGDKKRLGRLHKELEALQGMKSRTEFLVSLRAIRNLLTEATLTQNQEEVDRALGLFRKAKGFRYTALIAFPEHGYREEGEDLAIGGGDWKEEIEMALTVIAEACQINHNRRHAARSKRVLLPLLKTLNDFKLAASKPGFSGRIPLMLQILGEIGRDGEARGHVCRGFGEPVHEAVLRMLSWKSPDKSLLRQIQSHAATALCNLTHDTRTGLQPLFARLKAANKPTGLSELCLVLDQKQAFGGQGLDTGYVDAFESSLSALANLLTVKAIRKEFVDNKKMVKVILSLIVGVGSAARITKSLDNSMSPLLVKSLGVILNCSLEGACQPLVFGHNIVQVATNTLGLIYQLKLSQTDSEADLLTRLLLYIRRACGFMEKRGNLSREIIAKDTVPLMLQALDPKNYTNPSIREHVAAVLARCAKDTEGRVDITGFDGWGALVCALLDPNTSPTIHARANASILISQLAVDKANLDALTNAIPPLIQVLRLEGSSRDFKVMQKNAAVALAKLAKHPKNLVRIRQLHGIEMLYRAVASGI